MTNDEIKELVKKTKLETFWWVLPVLMISAIAAIVIVLCIFKDFVTIIYNNHPIWAVCIIFTIIAMTILLCAFMFYFSYKSYIFYIDAITDDYLKDKELKRKVLSNNYEYVSDERVKQLMLKMSERIKSIEKIIIGGNEFFE